MTTPTFKMKNTLSLRIQTKDGLVGFRLYLLVLNFFGCFVVNFISQNNLVIESEVQFCLFIFTIPRTKTSFWQARKHDLLYKQM